MSKEAWTIIGIVVLGLILVGALFVTFRSRNSAGIKRSKVRVKGPFGFRGEAEASDDIAPGVRVHDARSEAGGLNAEDKTGRGVDISKVVTRKDITVSNTPPPPTDPKV